MMKNCAHCGAENLPQAKFCANCGFSFPAEPPQSSAAPGSFASVPASDFPPSVPSADGVSSYESAVPASEPSSPPPASPLPGALIENHMPFTKKTMLDLYKGVKKAGVVILVSGLVLWAIYLATQWSGQRGETLDGISFIFGLIFVCLGVFYLLLPKIISKNQKLITDRTFRVFRFDETFMHIALFDGDAKIEELNIPYTAVTKVRRKEGFLWIWSGNAAFPINLFTFTKGTREDLKNLLLAKCGRGIVKIKN